MRVLVVEDETTLASAIAELLRSEAYAVDLATTGGQADELVAVNAYDVIVLDWGIPPPSGLDLLRRWRRDGLTMPVLMLTGRGEVADRVGGLDSGADDYLTKPFSFDELLARLRNLLRRGSSKPEVLDLSAGDVVVDPATREVRVDGRPVVFSPREFAVLEYLLRHKDRVVSREELSEHAWDDRFDAMSNVVDVTVHRVRKKIDGERTARLLHTVKGAGYMLRSERT